MTQERLLVVDDEAAFGTFVRRVGENLGFAVRVVTNAIDFETEYAAFKPTVVSLDIVMPETDGIELVQWLKRKAYDGRIVIISGYSPRYAKMAEMIAGTGSAKVQTLRKPVAIADLEAALKPAAA